MTNDFICNHIERTTRPVTPQELRTALTLPLPEFTKFVHAHMYLLTVREYVCEKTYMLTDEQEEIIEFANSMAGSEHMVERHFPHIVRRAFTYVQLNHAGLSPVETYRAAIALTYQWMQVKRTNFFGNMRRETAYCALHTKVLLTPRIVSFLESPAKI